MVSTPVMPSAMTWMRHELDGLVAMSLIRGKGARNVIYGRFMFTPRLTVRGMRGYPLHMEVQGWGGGGESSLGGLLPTRVTSRISKADLPSPAGIRGCRIPSSNLQAPRLDQHVLSTRVVLCPRGVPKDSA